MKKKIFLTICLAAIMFGLVGCEDPEWDHKSNGWVLWATGIVDTTRIQVINSTRKFIIEFEGDLKIEASNFHNFNDIKEKSKGSIYKYVNFSTYYMWVPDEEYNGASGTVPVKKCKEELNEQTTIAKKKAAFHKRADEITKRRKAEAWMERADEIVTGQQRADEIGTSWQKANKIENLKANDLVLIQLDNGIVAIGFVTYDKKWKLSLNKDKYEYGRTLTNVLKWKRINLE